MKLLWIAPMVTVLLTILMMMGNHIQAGAYNWWYTLILPGSMTLFIALTTSQENRKNRHSLFSVVPDKKRIGYAKIIFNALCLLMMCFLFFLSVQLACLLFHEKSDLMQTLYATFVLFLTFLWQIPCWMALTEYLGKFGVILISLLLNFGMGVVFAVKSLWWIPFSIPARLMCPIMKILPNGMLIEATDPLANFNVVLPGILITVLVFVVTSGLYTKWFDQRGC